MAASDDRDSAEYHGRYHELEASVKAAQTGHDAAAFLAAIVESSDDAIVSKSLEGIITTWNKAAELLFGYTSAEAIGQPITIVIPEDRLDEEPVILARIRAGERVDHFETIRRKKDGTLIDVSLTISPIRGGNGAIIGASKIARDISERKRSADRQNLLLREMHHRVKNLFAVTGSLITLAARSANTPMDLASDMKERLAALSQAHELTLPNLNEQMAGERSIALFALSAGILAPYQSGDYSNWVISGDDVEIGSERITSFALLLHELATNAAKYGSLSTSSGHLAVMSTLNHGTLTIRWTETQAPSRATDRRDAGFGSTLEKMIIGGLGASLTRDWQENGLQVEIVVPWGHLPSQSGSPCYTIVRQPDEARLTRSTRALAG